MLAAECADAGPMSFYCQEYMQLCCDATKYNCDNGKCSSRCNTDRDCFGQAQRCDPNGKCVECLSDSNCAMGETCQNEFCQAPCTSDGDCPAFNRCNNGQCVSSGCKTDRECIAATKNVEAKCGSDGKCTIPCQSDLECGNPKEYAFYSCISNQCVYVGCDTDKDCELYYTGGSDAAPPQHTHFICRNKTM
jgi:Cys-rich repeat protein